MSAPRPIWSSGHGCNLLVWYEAHDDLQQARWRERQIKKWNRSWKLELIEAFNPAWADLFDAITGNEKHR